ncbi:unnamed protein product [Boreogadus saida]
MHICVFPVVFLREDIFSGVRQDRQQEVFPAAGRGRSTSCPRPAVTDMPDVLPGQHPCYIIMLTICTAETAPPPPPPPSRYPPLPHDGIAEGGGGGGDIYCMLWKLLFTFSVSAEEGRAGMFGGATRRRQTLVCLHMKTGRSIREGLSLSLSLSLSVFFMISVEHSEYFLFS